MMQKQRNPLSKLKVNIDNRCVPGASQDPTMIKLEAKIIIYNKQKQNKEFVNTVYWVLLHCTFLYERTNGLCITKSSGSDVTEAELLSSGNDDPLRHITPALEEQFINS